MWELISSNIRKSWILFFAMGGCLFGLGYVVGAVWLGPEGAIYGILIAAGIWFILSLLSYFNGDSILLLSSGAKQVTHDIHPQLFNVVEEMKIAANFPVMPKIYIIPSPALNAFATGRSIEKCSIAVTAGLLSSLNRDELQGVIAHEMSHIINRDVLYLTIAGIMMGSIVLLGEVFLRSMWYGGSSRRYRSGSGGSGQAQLIFLILAIVLAILAPILARIFYFSLSRKREYLADASAVRLTRYPLGLASALERISGSYIELKSANSVTAPMYIDTPFKKKKAAVGLFSTHPPIQERIRILKNMAHGVNYTDYQQAFIGVTRRSGGIVPPSALRDSKTIPVRESKIPQRKPQERKTQARDVGDLLRALNRYVFVTCLCGLKIKIPPDFKQEKLECPRCGRKHQVPIADAKRVAAVLGAATALGAGTAKKEVYARKSTGWESFNCPSCGNLIQISPLFAGTQLRCQNCRTIIKIEKF
jgi:heat shock protein HtpX